MRQDLWIGTENMPDGGVKILLNGLIDAYSYHKLAHTFNNLIDYQINSISVDLSEVEHLSCAGASIFICFASIVQGNGGKLTMTNPKPNIREVFEILNSGQIFDSKNEPDSSPKASRKECPNHKTNLSYCNCSFHCHRKGWCCECLHYHRHNNELPACFFPKEVEKTYDRSFERFTRLFRF